jgi:membrane dipeptidase
VYTKGLEDVSKYPDLVQQLVDRGFSDPEIDDIIGGNFVRVLEKTIQASGGQVDETTAPHKPICD